MNNRYFTPSNVTEHLIPSNVLWTMDPKTGLPKKKLENEKKSSSNINGCSTGCADPEHQSNTYSPVSVQIRGTYGVSVVWNDPMKTSDIYTFDALRTISMTI